MSLQRPSTPSGEPDLESTAELPVLEVAVQDQETGTAPEQLSSTDTWIVTAASMSKEWPAVLDPTYIEERSRLEREVRTLTERLKDVEERLGVKDARVIQLEKDIEQLNAELAATRSTHAAAEHRAEELTTELQETRAELTAAQTQVIELQGQLEAREAAGTARQSRSETLESELARRTQALERAERDLRSLAARVEGYIETLRSLEGQRGVFEAMLREKDAEIDARDARLARLDLEMSKRDARIQELESDLAARVQQIEALQKQVNSLAAALASANEQITSLRNDNRDLQSRVARLMAAAERRAARERDTVQIPALSMLRESDTGRYAVDGDATLRNLRELHSTRTDGAAANTQDPGSDGVTRLLIRSENGSEIVHVLGRKTSIGRTPDNDIQIETKFISRHHALILTGPVSTFIEDLNSTNGVMVNNRRITRQTLRDGDIVTIGKTQFRYVVRTTGEKH